jgi:hypothetical protein
MKEAYPEQVRQCVFYITSVYARSSLNINNAEKQFFYYLIVKYSFASVFRAEAIFDLINFEGAYFDRARVFD